MSRRITTLGTIALGAMLVVGSPADGQQSTGPIREGARRTGQAVAQGTRAAAEATGEVVRRTGQATKNIARGAANTVRRATGQQPVPYDSRGQVRANAQLNADSQQGTYAGQELDQGSLSADAANQTYRSGYRGTVENQLSFSSRPDNGGRVYPLLYDSQGREFICVNGSPVYFSTASGADTQQSMAADQNQGDYEYRDGQRGDYEVPPAPQPSNIQSGQSYQANRPLDDGQMINADDEAGAQTSSDSNASTGADASSNTSGPSLNSSTEGNTSFESNQSGAESEAESSIDADADANAESN